MMMLLFGNSTLPAMLPANMDAQGLQVFLQRGGIKQLSESLRLQVEAVSRSLRLSNNSITAQLS